MRQAFRHFNPAQRLRRLLAGLARTMHSTFEGGQPGRSARTAQAKIPRRASTAPWRVLVADDNRAHLEQACGMLEHHGAVTMRAGDGAEAVAIACAHEFDLILMDLRMPILGGLAATQQIRAYEFSGALGRVPVLAYAAVLPTADVLRHNGLDGALSKPCDATAMEACLRHWCARPAFEARRVQP